MRTKCPLPEPESILISESDLRHRVRCLGAQIASDYQGQEFVLLGVLRGSALFFADLARAIFEAQPTQLARKGLVRFEFVQLTSYDESTEPSTVELIHGGSDYLGRRHVLIVEDIIDTGHTLKFLREHLWPLNPKTLKVCTLLDKPARHRAPITLDYVGFEIPDVFVVGYGLDYAQHYRNLPYIALLESF